MYITAVLEKWKGIYKLPVKLINSCLLWTKKHVWDHGNWERESGKWNIWCSEIKGWNPTGN